MTRPPMSLSETFRVLAVIAMWAICIGGLLGWMYVESENRILRDVFRDLPEK